MISARDRRGNPPTTGYLALGSPCGSASLPPLSHPRLTCAHLCAVKAHGSPEAALQNPRSDAKQTRSVSWHSRTACQNRALADTRTARVLREGVRRPGGQGDGDKGHGDERSGRARKKDRERGRERERERERESRRAMEKRETENGEHGGERREQRVREFRSRANQGVEEPVSPFDKTADSLSRGGARREPEESTRHARLSIAAAFSLRKRRRGSERETLRSRDPPTAGAPFS